MTKILEALAVGTAALLFAAAAVAQLNPPISSGVLQPIEPPPPVSLPFAQVSVPPPVTTVTMPQKTPAPTSAPARAAPAGGGMARAAPPSPRIGDVTQALMALQASGRVAGPQLLMQEPMYEAGWDRYLKSFQHPLPQWFSERVKTDGGSGSSSGGQ